MRVHGHHGAVIGLAGLAMALAACGGDSGGGGSAAAGEVECAEYQQYGKFEDKTVSIYSAIVAPQDVPHIESYEKFESCTGITVEFQGDKQFDTQVQVRIEGGNPPDLAVFAQPGLVKQLAASGDAVEAPEAVAENVDEFWSDAWRDYVTVDGKLYGAPLGANVKSFVWYSPREFEENGYEIPQTLDELKALSDTIAATGEKPWCVGINSGDATGWPVTDWMEDMMLRLYGAETYDSWVNHEVPFNGPEATASLDAAGAYLRNPAYVNGGLGDIKSIASTTFQDAGLPILQGQCSLHRQGSFYAENWPEGTDVSENGDVFAFYLPARDDSSKPVLGGGEFLVAFSDRPEVQAFQAFLSSDTWANEKVASTPGGGWVSANTGMNASKLPNPIDRLSAEILQDPKAVFRYDGSDQMPGAVGTDAFWKQSTNWILGQSTEETLGAIEKAWPTS
jgi:alpha-glucoside transport system substrate-binding protein